jgi:hypothetical protein
MEALIEANHEISAATFLKKVYAELPTVAFSYTKVQQLAAVGGTSKAVRNTVLFLP